MQQLVSKNLKWAVEFTGKVLKYLNSRLLQVADSILSCPWLWFLLARWIDSELHALFSLYALVTILLSRH